MSILLVDIGNTRIKWARFDGQRLGRQHAAVFAGWKSGDFARRVVGVVPGVSSRRGVGRIVVASVAGERVNRMFIRAARNAHAPKPEFVSSQRRAGGVTTQYVEPWRLGVDRFAMAIGAHDLAKGVGVCIVSVGTALTIDLVNAAGTHLGGAILPSPHLMVDSLLTKTNGIRRRAAGSESSLASRLAPGRAGSIFARSTRAAIEQGALLAAAAAIDRGAQEAAHMLGQTPLVVLTGGGAKAVAPLIQTTHVSVPGLVLHGLAVLAQEGTHPSKGS